jgi:hypothetical protein
MTRRSLLVHALLLTGSTSMAVGLAIGCSSSTVGPSACSGTACEDANTAADTSIADTGNGGDTGSPAETGASDAGTESDVVGDGPRDGASPTSLYGACALMGSFGWPCTLTASGADPAECTDPNYSQCFVGGQGAWCTKLCTGNGDCTAVEDAGCVPTECNARGWCK